MPQQQCADVNSILTWSKLHSTCSKFNDDTCVKTWSKLNMWQTCWLTLYNLRSDKPPVDNILFYKHSDPNFQWLTAAHNDKFLWLLVVLSLTHNPPVYYTGSHTCTVGVRQCGYIRQANISAPVKPAFFKLFQLGQGWQILLRMQAQTSYDFSTSSLVCGKPECTNIFLIIIVTSYSLLQVGAPGRSPTETNRARMSQ
jgi:hypothetical protein